MALTKIGKEGITGISNASNANAITIDASENVGIGTTSPQELLHLSQTGGSTIRFQNLGARVWSIGNDGTSFVVDDVTGSKETLRIDGTGVVMGGGSLAAPRTADLQIHTDVAGGAVSFGDESSVVISTNATGAGSQGYIGSLWFGSQDVSQSSQYGWKMAGMAGYMSGDTGTSGGSADLLFYTASASQTGTERMRIDSSGNVLVGTTTKRGKATILYNTNSTADATLFLSNDGGSGVWVSFGEENGTVRGSISKSSGSTAYNTSSDYRLKENVVYDWDATTRLKQLKPARFNFIEYSDKTVDGFIAHEVSSIVPEAITGTKDAMTTEVLYIEGDELPDGKSVGDVKEASVPDYQGIDQSKLVPLLVKTIQELEARLTAGGL